MVEALRFEGDGEYFVVLKQSSPPPPWRYALKLNACILGRAAAELRARNTPPVAAPPAHSIHPFRPVELCGSGTLLFRPSRGGLTKAYSKEQAIEATVQTEGAGGCECGVLGGRAVPQPLEESGQRQPQAQDSKATAARTV